MDPLSLSALVGVLSAFYIEGRPPEAPAGGDEGNLDDATIWDRIARGGNVLGECTFYQAVNNDPRRIDALIWQRLLLAWFAIEGLVGERPMEILRHSYLVQLSSIRDTYGVVSAEGLAEAARLTWEGYDVVLSKAAWPMAQRGAPEATRLRAAIIENHNDIFRGFREAREIARRAAGEATREIDQDAWERIGAIIERSWSAMADHMIRDEVEEEQLIWGGPGGGGASGGGGAGSAYGATWTPGVFPSGHRSPHAAYPQWRAMGGRIPVPAERW